MDRSETFETFETFAGPPKFVKALYSWSGEEKNDLGFVEGDIIEVLNTGDGNWWIGRLKRNKVVGSFPKNFVEHYDPKGKKSSSVNPLNTSKQLQKQQQRQLQPTNEFDKSIADMVNELSISQSLSSSGSSAHSHRSDDVWDDDDNDEYNNDGTDISLSDVSESIDADYMTGYVLPRVSAHHGDTYSDFDNDDLHEPSGAPPVPPPHRISLNPSSRVSSSSTATATADGTVKGTPTSYTTDREIDRTPSPLRNAMDDVLSSLDQMDDISRNGSLSYPEPLKRKDASHDSIATLTAAGRSPSPYLNRASTNDLAAPSVTGYAAADFDEDGIPYDPDSYNSLDKLARHSSSAHSISRYNNQSAGVGYRHSMQQLSNVGSAVNEQHVSRADTYKSVSSVTTNSLSIMSSSTTPTTISTDSLASKGSFIRRREAINPPGVSTDYYSSYGESPTNLPNAKPSTNSTNSGTLKSLKLKNSSGFLKKLFIGTNPLEKAQEEEAAGSQSLARSTSTRSSRSSRSTSLRRSISRSSRISTSSTSSRIKNRLREVSSMTFGMKSGGTSDGSSIFSRRKSIGSSNDLESSTHWIEIRRDVHRANTLTPNEIAQRRRNLDVVGIQICEPLVAMSLIQGEETYSGELLRTAPFDPSKQNYASVDEAILGLRTWPQLMTPPMFASSKIGRVFDSEADQLRAIFDFCAGKFVWEPTVDLINIVDDWEDDFASLARIMQTKKATSQEIAYCVKSMCDTLNIVCTVVHGQLKMPGEMYTRSSVPKINHSWNAVVIDDEWRFIDASLANPTFPSNEYYSKSSGLNRHKSVKGDRLSLYRADSIASITGYHQDTTSDINYFYFLTRPTHLIYTHVPCKRYQQHLLPPLQDLEALSLPIAGSQAFEAGISLVNYHSGITVLENLEMTELNFVVPGDLELVAEVLAGNIKNLGLLQGHYDTSHLTKIPGLAQAYWKNNRRYVRVKAFLPEPHSQGILNVYARARVSNQASSKNSAAPLIYSFGISHNGSNAPYEFITRHPTPHCKRQDIYVIQPQCKRLVGGNSYVFEVRQHPSGGITSGAGFGRVKLAIQSPSGRMFKLRKKDCEDSGSVFGVWEVNARCYEVGTWRGLVLADQGNAWSVFSEWDCV